MVENQKTLSSEHSKRSAAHAESKDLAFPNVLKLLPLMI